MRTKREIMADALEEIDAKLEQIVRALGHIADGLNQHEVHMTDQVNRLGARVHELERRMGNGR